MIAFLARRRPIPWRAAALLQRPGKAQTGKPETEKLFLNLPRKTKP